MVFGGILCTYKWLLFGLIMLDHQHLKARQREERESHSEGLALRVHRALSWLQRSENVMMKMADLSFYGSLLMRPMPKALMLTSIPRRRLLW